MKPENMKSNRKSVSKLDNYKSRITRLLTMEGYSFDRCSEWLLEKHGVSATRELLRGYAARNGIERASIRKRLQAVRPTLVQMFGTPDHHFTLGRACRELLSLHKIRVSAPTLEKWLRDNELFVHKPLGYQDDLNRLAPEIMMLTASRKLSAREVCEWLHITHALVVPVSALKQWLNRSGHPHKLLLVRKRISRLDSVRDGLVTLFSNPAATIIEGIDWLNRTDGPIVSPQALINWLEANGLREPKKERQPRNLTKLLNTHKDALFSKFDKRGFSVSMGVEWVGHEFGIIVSSQTLSSWLHKNGKKPKGHRGPAPKYKDTPSVSIP